MPANVESTYFMTNKRILDTFCRTTVM